ncbi:S8 family serine peptidase [Paenactinomyces guangxiensis]|uniref:S8 family serine peptidase n=1 Tax=Paenactinomyces guangxiensis TaxID=1490290 RepID=A0A7W1WRY3_9BACL|nr:S8 family serine peptidase [Paenactinomyces guangxiensis]MBA4494964.1 S8 family serine peptidase [Paenactinomyces guangxiensis]MBH8592047.1 S8 family serine peptidase [Paenactinomyces guangxiensis]
MKKLISTGLTAVLTISLLVSGMGTAAAAGAGKEIYTVNFKGNTLPSHVQKIIQDTGGSLVKSDAELAYVQAVSNDPQFLRNIRKNPSVEDAGRTLKVVQEAAVEKAALEADDAHPIYDQYQWDIKQVTQEGASYQLPKGKGTRDVVVAVIDTGIDLEHPDLKANIVDAKSFVPGENAQDYDGHGSHVAGSIAGNGKALGIGPELGIAALKVFPKDGGGASTASIAEALKYAADQDYDVVNMSLGSYAYLQDPAYDTNDIRADINLFKKAIAYAHKKGVTIVGSAGNASADISSPGKLSRYLFDENGATHRDPASNLLIRVSAGSKGKTLTFYSNYGVGKIDVMAPGGDLGPNYDPVNKTGRDNAYLCYSTVPVVDSNYQIIGHGYAGYAGTSMAAPKVAGIAGVIIAKHGKNKLSPAQVKSIIQQSAEDIYKNGYDAESGFGLANALNALQYR